MGTLTPAHTHPHTHTRSDTHFLTHCLSVFLFIHLLNISPVFKLEASKSQIKTKSHRYTFLGKLFCI